MADFVYHCLPFRKLPSSLAHLCVCPLQLMPAGVLTGTGLLGLYYHYQKMQEWA